MVHKQFFGTRGEEKRGIDDVRADDGLAFGRLLEFGFLEFGHDKLFAQQTVRHDNHVVRLECAFVIGVGYACCGFFVAVAEPRKDVIRYSLKISPSYSFCSI